MSYAKLTDHEMATIAPVKDGAPDLYNFMPTRKISKTEAEDRGWTWFYQDEVCAWGHRAPRYVAKPRQCVDCRRVGAGKQPIGAKGAAEYTGRQTSYPQRAPTVGSPVPKSPEPTEIEKKFLIEYAKLKDFTAAALAMRSDPAVFQARLSWNEVFSAACDKLEAECGIARTMRLDEVYEWTEDKRTLMLRVYIDTGDMGLARSAIGVSNYHFQLEIESNTDFARRIEEAGPLAMRVFEEDAFRRSRQGSDKLLEKMLTAAMPDKYGNRVRVDMSVTEKLTHEQLIGRIQHVFRSLPAPVIGALIEHDSQGSADVVGDGSGAEQEDREESAADLL